MSVKTENFPQGIYKIHTYITYFTFYYFCSSCSRNISTQDSLSGNKRKAIAAHKKKIELQRKENN